MPHTDEELAEIQRQFAARRRRQIILMVPVVLLIVFGFALRAGVDFDRFGIHRAWAGPVFLILILAAVTYSFVNWRCPACNVYLGRALSLRFCPRCGTELK